MIDPADLRRLLRYDAASGSLYWLPRPEEMFPGTGRGGRRGEAARWNGQFAGKLALTAYDSHGYRQGGILGTNYLAHRVIVALVTGAWPEKQVDHRNRVRSDNRWANLRHATNAQNAKNRSKHVNNTTGRTGVYWHRANQNWFAKIGGEREGSFLGSFATFEEARAARQAAERALGYDVSAST